MISFKEYLQEEVEATDKLKHLQHAEELPYTHGADGFYHAANALKAVHEKLKSGKGDVHITGKADGSPSVVFGHHPESGKFFVATKSAFNKDPKINYSHADIEHNHSPGLQSKLKDAFTHLSKVAPKKGVFQGDMMYSKGDVTSHSDHHHFTPNTITYSAHKDSEHGKAVAKAHMGMVVHTEYHGDTFEGMKAGFKPDLGKFKSHHDAHIMSPEIKKTGEYTGKEQKTFNDHMKAAHDIHTNNPQMYDAVKGHVDHISTYMNKTVRTGEEPSTAGLKNHIQERGQAEAAKVKTPAAKEAKITKAQSHIAHIETHKHSFDNMIAMHNHIQKAKDTLVNVLSKHTDLKHSINGTAAVLNSLAIIS
jgi:hypothetical protein